MTAKAFMTTDRIIKLGRRTTLVSFLLGSAIFGLYFWTSVSDVLIMGYAYFLIAALINVWVFALILIRSGKDEGNRSRLIWTGLLMLVNIPIASIYMYVAMILLDTIRITFRNSTDAILTDINVSGCGTHHIDKLGLGQSETLWITISHDCTLIIDYMANGHRTEAPVAGYLTNGMGQKLEYNIGGESEELF